MMNLNMQDQRMFSFMLHQALLLSAAKASSGMRMPMHLPAAPYSPLSGSSCSMIESPVKSECSQTSNFTQDEPLNLCIRDRINAQVSYNSPSKKRMRVPRNHPIQKKSKSFKCNLCQCVYSCLNDLAEHTSKIHGGYRCHLCNTRFTQRSNLQRHALRHIGFKPYTCGVCKREYYRKDHLIRHITFNHPDAVPKDVIIQRMSSSESLSYIEKESSSNDEKPSEFNVIKREDEEVEVIEPRPISDSDTDCSMSGDHYSTPIKSEDSANVFLTSNPDLHIDVVGI